MAMAPAVPARRAEATGDDASTIRGFMAVLCVALCAFGGLAVLMGGPTSSINPGAPAQTTGASDAPAPPVEQTVAQVRALAGTYLAGDVEQLIDHKVSSISQNPSFVRDDEGTNPPFTSADMARMQALGKLTVVDREGRAEVHWDHISSATCKALVTDIYTHPTTHNVTAFLDGKTTGFSCNTPSHSVVLTPHL